MEQIKQVNKQVYRGRHQTHTKRKIRAELFFRCFAVVQYVMVGTVPVNMPIWGPDGFLVGN